MADQKCPACRRRFSALDGDSSCSRCGADLSLLKRLITQSECYTVKALQAMKDRPQDALALIRRASHVKNTGPSAHLLEKMLEE